VHQEQRQKREKRMNKEPSIKTALCGEYLRLLEECQRTLEIWNNRRAEISRSRLIKEEEGDELLRLQANFARAYAMLQHHAQECELCELVCELEGRAALNGWESLSDNSQYI
jgi:hypothetical protein